MEPQNAWALELHYQLHQTPSLDFCSFSKDGYLGRRVVHTLPNASMHQCRKSRTFNLTAQNCWPPVIVQNLLHWNFWFLVPMISVAKYKAFYQESLFEVELKVAPSLPQLQFLSSIPLSHRFSSKFFENISPSGSDNHVFAWWHVRVVQCPAGLHGDNKKLGPSNAQQNRA